MMRNRAPQVNLNQNIEHQQRGSQLRHADAVSKSGVSCSLVAQRNVFLLLSAFLGFLLFLVLLHPPNGACSPSSHISKLRRDTGSCEMTLGTFRGHEYTLAEGGTIGKPKCLVESKWLKLSQHTVRIPGSDIVVDDWMWIDYHDRINVLVEDETKPGEERQFLVFEQSKYALEGRMSLAVIGGIIEPGEDPEHAARREVEEEMNGMQCKNFHFLGRFRTDVNRGMGWVNSFLATKCSRDAPKQNHQLMEREEVGAADTERQDLKRVSLEALTEAARGGLFLEVQWSATVALALIHPELML